MIASSFPGSSLIGSHTGDQTLPDVFTVWVNGINLTANVYIGTSGSEGFSVSEILTGTTTGSLVLVEEDAPNGPTLDIQIGHHVIIEHRTGRIFGGEIEDLARTNPGQSNVIFYRCALKDFSAILERRLATISLEDTGDPVTQTAGEIIETLHTTYLQDSLIMLGEIADGPLIQKATFDFVTIANALNDIQKLTGNAFYWRVDQFGVLHFRERTEIPAPYDITEDQVDIIDLSFESSKEAYRNRQWVRGGKTETTATKTDEFEADGKQKTFTLSLPVASKPIILVNAVAVDPDDIGIKGVDENNPAFTWLFARDDPVIAAKTAPTAGADIEIEYIGLFPILVRRDDPGEQASRAAIEMGDGIYEGFEEDESKDVTGARQLADALIDKYSRIPKSIRYQTDDQGFIETGQLQTVTLTRLAVTAQMLIEQVDMILVGDDLRRSINATDGREWLEWLEFFRSLLKKPFKIRENESILTPITLSETLDLADNGVVVDLSDTLNVWTTDPYSFMIVGDDWSIAKVNDDGNPDGPDIGDPLIT